MQWSFWLLNIGLLWMVFISLLPLGTLQLYHSVAEGYVEARSLGYITQPDNAIIEWLRLPGDVIFLAGIPGLIWGAFKAIRHSGDIPTMQDEEEFPVTPLFSKIESEENLEPAGAGTGGSPVGLVSGGHGRVDNRSGAELSETLRKHKGANSSSSTKWGGSYSSDNRDAGGGEQRNDSE